MNTDYRYDDAIKLTRLIEKGEAPFDEIKRQKDGLDEVRRYCNNDSDCRRKVILEHFDQKDPVECHKMCDVCAKGEVMVEEDVTRHALDILRLTEDLTENGSVDIPKGLVQSVYRGSAAKEVKNRGFDLKPLYGVGKSIPNDRVSRIFDHLISENALRYVSVNKGAWSAAYLQVRWSLHHSEFYLTCGTAGRRGRRVI